MLLLLMDSGLSKDFLGLRYRRLVNWRKDRLFEILNHDIFAFSGILFDMFDFFLF